MNTAKNKVLQHGEHQWIHLNSGSEEEVYKLYSDQELVSQAWPDIEMGNKQFVLSNKEYKTQVWHQETGLSLENALDNGNRHMGQYLNQVKEHGPARQLPPYLHKEQRGEHVWTVDARGAKGALLLEYIENDKGQVIAGMAHIDEGGEKPAYYVDNLHPRLGPEPYLFRTHNLEIAYRDCEEKATQYHMLSKTGYEWVYQNEEHPMGYILENTGNECIAIIYPNDESRTVDAYSNATLEVRDIETKNWKVMGWNMDLPQALEWGNEKATAYLTDKMERDKSIKYPGVSPSRDKDPNIDPIQDIEMDI
ncbi:MAG: hypothetical protein AAFO95_16595 [Cyanobacteria bacterium J06600_6]